MLSVLCVFARGAFALKAFGFRFMAMNKKSNIILIGMPGAGKSTVGVILAKMTARDFLDTDVLIQVSEGRSLQDIVDKDGDLALRNIEERVLLDLRCENHVIATGGSAVYSEKAMAHVKAMGVVVFLDVDLPTLKKRLYNIQTRGIAKRPDQTLEQLFEERQGLYRKYADITIKSAGLSQEEVCERIISRLGI